MDAYATRDDVYLLALSAQAFVTRPRPLESYTAADFNPTTGIIRLVGHGFSAADVVMVMAVSGGYLPIGLAALTPYYPLPLTSDLVRVAATPSGAPLAFSVAVTGAVSSGGLIKLTTATPHGLPNGATVSVSGVGGTIEANGTWVITSVDATHMTLVGSVFVNAYTSGGAVASQGLGWSIAVDPGRRLDAHLVESASEINEHLTAHDPPILPDPITLKYPQVLIGLNARMAARAAVTSLQIENAAFKVAVDRLVAKEDFDATILADWKSGKPVHPTPKDEDDLANNGARAASSRASAGWQTGRL